MKLVVPGATGFLATEVIRQGLNRPEVTSLVAVSRKPIKTPHVDAVSAAKLRQVIIEDYAEYPDDVKKELAGANACIWTVAITPSKSLTYKFDDVRRVCYTSTLAVLDALHEGATTKPFRFLHTSGQGIDRETTREASGMLGPYLSMRTETEISVLDFEKQHPGDVDVGIARPGLITSNATVFRAVWGSAMRWTGLGTSITREELAAAMLEQVIKGFEKDTLLNDDLVRIGRKALQDEAGSSK